VIREVRSDGTIDFGGAFTSIPRPRIVSRIAEAAAYRVALVVAPAGYGKSTALREYLRSVGDCVLYELTPENSTLHGFVRGFVNALGDVGQKSHKTLVGAFAESRDSASRPIEIATWLHSHIKSFVGTIAVDDLHIGDEDPEVAAFLTSLVERTRGRVRWILASRSTLELPVASWLAYGESGLAVDEVDLAFDLDEARRAARSARVAVRDDELQSLLTLTAGWPTALAFALRSSTRSDDLRRTTMTTREMTFRYLAEQVYADLPEEMRAFLLTVSLLPRLDIAVLTRAGFDRAEAMLEWLRNRVSFITLDAPGIYRVHDLFREFLEFELRLLGHAATLERISVIAAALDACERKADALAMYLRAELWDDVERILTRDGFALQELGHVDLLERAVAALPQRARATNPAVLGLRATFEFERRRFDDAERLYARALLSTDDLNLRIKLSLLLATIRVNLQQKTASAVLEPLHDCPDASIESRCEVASVLACALAIEGKIDGARVMVEFARDLLLDIDSEDVRARAKQHAGFVSFYADDAESAKRDSLDAATLASTNGMYALAATAFSLLYNVAERDHDQHQMLWYAQQVVTAALKGGKRSMHAVGLLEMLDIETLRGNGERAADLEGELRRSHGADALRDPYCALPSLALQSAWAGDFTAAWRFIAGSPERIMAIDRRCVQLAWLAIYSAGDARREAALETLATLDTTLAEASLAQSGIDPHLLHFARCLGAIANALLSRFTVAARLLRASRPVDPDRDWQGRVARILCDGSGHIDRDALNDAVHDMRNQGFGGYARFFIIAADRIEGDRGVVETPLTSGEIAVLRALSSGRSPKAIAADTGRSVNTVSNHVRSAITKLQCHGRSEAIAIAQRRGILDRKPTSRI